MSAAVFLCCFVVLHFNWALTRAYFSELDRSNDLRSLTLADYLDWSDAGDAKELYLPPRLDISSDRRPFIERIGIEDLCL